MFNFKILLLTILSTAVFANSLSIDENTQFYDLLPSSQIYIDKSRTLTIEDIQKKDIKFKSNDKKLLAFGYSPDFNVWIKFTLKNNTDKKLEKFLEYGNGLTTDIIFYDYISKRVEKEGLLNKNEQRKSLNPIFKISLEANETKTYYIQASSYIATLIVKLNLWDSTSFYEKEMKHQIMLALFFGAMFILAVYNLFIYFFTKDISYMFYVLYILGVNLHHSLYTGIANIYFMRTDWTLIFLEIAPGIIMFPIYALALFTKSFLHIESQSKHNKILSLFLILIPISLVYLLLNDDFLKYRNILPMALSVFLIYLTIYNAIKRNRQAYFILFGWIIIFIAILAMNLSSAGFFNLYKYFPYIIETAFVLEAIVFSIALADRIKQLQKEKIDASKKLITQQKNEKERLKIQVSEKTKDLKVALDEKGLLLKELNHRVKNNMQTIVSLVRLQGDEIEDERFQNVFITIQNRINAMSHLHELLYRQDNISHVNAYAYFDILIDELKESYDNEVDINFDIKTELKMEQAIYCGLILNELITNSFKYAFPNKKGNININLKKENGKYKLYISDNGIGYSKDTQTDSLGLILVNTLAKEQLRGDIMIDSLDGVEVEITWS